ncbi:hypothetical protein [Nocardia brasiliensis]|uniref:hypothetical protein n=1 Tax=Nocardia brasiliensis TaxID=37326 RepID=UPI0024572E6B|nr:hypothetical protein [Nocardia brasiliensis]
MLAAQAAAEGLKTTLFIKVVENSTSILWTASRGHRYPGSELLRVKMKRLLSSVLGESVDRGVGSIARSRDNAGDGGVVQELGIQQSEAR